MNQLVIDADIRKAHTPPVELYTGKNYFIRSKAAVFARSWQPVADTANMRLPQQLLPHTLLEGYLDEPLLLSRDKAGTLHCLSNVCTHRGNLLVDAPCSAQHIRCRYHGRRFHSDGKFQFMPEFEGVENFPSAADNLHAVPHFELEPLVLASVNPAAPAAAFFGDMLQRMHWFPFEHLRKDPVRSRDYLVKANWALYCENYLEGFHIPYVHADLSAALDYSNYTTELFPWSSLQLGISRGGDHVFELPAGSPDYGKQVSAYYWWVFPNLMFNFYPWGLSLNIVRPLGVALTRVSFITYILDESKLEQGAGAQLDKVEREDEAIVEAVQKGVKSSFYKSGRYSPTRETGTHHFHRLLADALNQF